MNSLGTSAPKLFQAHNPPQLCTTGPACAHHFQMITRLHRLADKRGIGSRLFKISDGPDDNETLVDWGALAHGAAFVSVVGVGPLEHYGKAGVSNTQPHLK
jgi:hypothetical protein